jgi:GTP cyclohydrolase I
MAASTKPSIPEAAKHYLAFMRALQLPVNEDTQDTPLRVARMFSEEFCSFNGGAPKVAKFKRKDYDQYVVVRNIEYASLCEHHHLPFEGMIHVGYHPREWLAGLSKIARVVRYFAGRPQLQEHLVRQIAEYLMDELNPHGVMVVAFARHACMSCRGVRAMSSETVTSTVLPDHGAIDKREMMLLMGLR